jgi:transcriptional regulatory protein RtcR
MKPCVVIGLLGSTLDKGSDPRRWERWRPTLCLVQQPDLVIDRLELLHAPQFSALARTVEADIKQVSPETVVVLHPIHFEDPWNLECVFSGLYDFASNYPFDVEKEDYLVHITTGTHVAQICCFLLTESRHFPARLIQSKPAEKWQEGPGSVDIIDLDLSKYDSIARRFADERHALLQKIRGGIPSQSASFNQLMGEILLVASASTDPMLLTGPTGAGKTALARRVFDIRKAQGTVRAEMVEVNCATLRGDFAMSTLFGHRKGAFTGASEDRQGLLKKADGGMLFLDEIGELGLDEQAMLLHAIEDHRFFAMGSDKPTESRFILVAGTNRDLQERVREGKFRDDLLARIHTWSFRLPGLNERLEDLESNLDHEIASFSASHNRRITFSREAREAYLNFARSAQATWSGNFRDLNASVVRMSTLAEGGRIDIATVAREITRLRALWHGSTPSNRVDLVLGDDALSIDRFDRVQLEDVLAVCATSPSLSEAGRILFSESRKTKQSSNDSDRLRKFLAKFGLEFKDVKALLSPG